MSKKYDIIWTAAHWCAKQEIPASETIDLVYRLLCEIGESEGYDSIPELKKDIAKVYSQTLGYEYHE